jgi:pimeloyl-ACP methyl ester carboxylesterase
MKKVCILIAVLFINVSVGVAQVSFKVDVKGRGEPVLLFPGFACPGEVWEETVNELAKTHECHIFTFAGFGGVKPIDTPWFSAIKDEVILYVKLNKLKSPMILGHSLGGTLGLWLASEEVKMFKKVIVVDGLPGAIALMNPAYNKGDKLAYNTPQSKSQLEMSDEAFAEMSKQMASYMSLNKDKQSIISDWMRQADRKTYVYGYIDYLNTDLRDGIAKIEIPVVVIGATFPSREIVEPNFIRQYEQLKGVKFEYVDNSAHFIMFDQPEVFIKKIQENIR